MTIVSILCCYSVKSLYAHMTNRCILLSFICVCAGVLIYS